MTDEITPKPLFLNRRSWIKAATIAASLPATAATYRWIHPVDLDVPARPPLRNWAASSLSTAEARQAGFVADDWQTSLYDITHLNNFQEFTTDQHDVGRVAEPFTTDQWSLSIGGLVERPLTLDLEQIRSQFAIEQRVYRMRCVEGWSMVIPWAGFPLAQLLDRVRPTGQAAYVAFRTLHDPSRMPNQIPGELRWPYTEGLRLDEAMHPLTLMATGLYGCELPPQNGAPIRLVVPWKYGFKSIKSIVAIELTDQRPETAWNLAAPRENGFYANVNPSVDHPRWSQATERRVGEFTRRETQMFNGYESQVAQMYRGMDLRVDY